jgi:hypothetical protein
MADLSEVMRIREGKAYRIFNQRSTDSEFARSIGNPDRPKDTAKLCELY